MNLYEPFPRSFITQKFAQNRVEFYKEHNLVGHTAVDYGVACGTPVPNCVDGAYVYSLMNKDNADLDKYRAVCTLFEDGDTVWEIIYGHLDQIYATVGQTLKVGEIVATSGNTGDVYMGDLKVTNELRKVIPCAGGHLHGPQVRKCRKVKKVGEGQYITDANGLVKWNGYFLEAVDYDNGLNACVDPFAFYNGKLATTGKSSGSSPIPAPLPFTKDLMRGVTDPEVQKLQQWLNAHGYPVIAKGKETTYFGALTEAAVIKLQKAVGIKPVAGYVGELTRQYLNNHLT